MRPPIRLFHYLRTIGFSESQISFPQGRTYGAYLTTPVIVAGNPATLQWMVLKMK